MCWLRVPEIGLLDFSFVFLPSKLALRFGCIPSFLPFLKITVTQVEKIGISLHFRLDDLLYPTRFACVRLNISIVNNPSKPCAHREERCYDS